MKFESINVLLVQHGEQIFSRPYELVQFTASLEADILINNLDDYPHAFVIACIMDRQIKTEIAWSIPYEIKKRLGSFEFAHLQALSLQDIKSLMTQPTPLHRFPADMAKNFYLAIQHIGGEYSGKASNIWAGRPASATIVRRFLAFHGVGPKIATMATNILVRDFKIPVSDKSAIDVSVDVQVRRVFERLGLITKNSSEAEIIYRARELNPTYPGIIDLAAWEIGRKWCRPTFPLCRECYMYSCCPGADIM